MSSRPRWLDAEKVWIDIRVDRNGATSGRIVAIDRVVAASWPGLSRRCRARSSYRDELPLWHGVFNRETAVRAAHRLRRRLSRWPTETELALWLLWGRFESSDDRPVPGGQAGECRPKGHEQVAPASSASNADAELHGGDGCSAEVDHAAARGAAGASGHRSMSADVDSEEELEADREQAGDLASVDADASGLTNTETEADATRVDSSRDAADAALPAKTPEHFAADGLSSSEHAECDDAVAVEPTGDAAALSPDNGSAVPLAEPGAEDDRTHADVDTLDKGTPRSDAPSTARREDQGCSGLDGLLADVGRRALFARPDCAGEQAIVAREPDRRALRRADRRLVAAIALLAGRRLGAGQRRPVPRVDEAALVRELVSRRASLVHARRRERISVSIIIVMIDTSGSCAHVCRALEAQAESLAAVDQRVIMVTHCNGEPYSPCELVGRHAALVAETIERRRRTVARHCPWGAIWSADPGRDGVRVDGVVSLADWHPAEIVHRPVAEAGVPLFWLDHYTSRMVGRPRDHTRRVDWRAAGWKRRPTAYVVGVGDGEQLVEGLLLGLKRRTCQG